MAKPATITTTTTVETSEMFRIEDILALLELSKRDKKMLLRFRICILNMP